MNNTNNIRQVVLDIETTGMNINPPYYTGHKIIEIGIIEIINRQITGNFFHTYINPMQDISFEANKIHGITKKFLLGKPVFKDIVLNLLNYIQKTKLIIHNAQFDIDFLNYELSLLKNQNTKIENICSIVDTLKMARNFFPGKRNSLNALCARFSINTKQRVVHGALLDAKLLANVYLAMTSKQNKFILNTITNIDIKFIKNNNLLDNNSVKKLIVIHPTIEEQKLHKMQIMLIKKKCGYCLWQ
ncbi:DNA polymerase III subunit epsilon [Enterobacteriaceae endosymbiont of Macroplea appendiculata]|uniref:DNA polymerase III subunit epsilon n=1 Tax=Enterobacteriaceae endosymbiont of Macroplea appendiculata TaxID=2675790 RepID=UPI0014490A22|nr:DNA polymerase III subunit epsilon [Enterobacteriaceae endosymbiont of Macroplea appendiculata]QJC30753.1 DNA polymerase III subunit epsilon [Enterobacteriaceae endosymbiont of Macroplea appendiculata]